MRTTLLAIAAIFMITTPQIMGARVWERSSRKVKSNASQGIQSGGKHNKNAEAISKVDGKAAVDNDNKIKGDLNNVVQIGDARSKIDSDADAKNRKLLIEGVDNNAVEGIRSGGRRNKNAQAISKVNANASVHNNNNIHRDYNTVVQVGDAKNKIDSDADARNNKLLIEGVDNNGAQGIRSGGRHNKNAQAISKVNANASVHNNNNIHGDYNNVVQVGDAKNKIDSDADARNNKLLIEGVENNANQGIKSHGRRNNNAQAISKVNANASVHNNNNIHGDFNNVVQVGDAKNKIDSDANAKNNKLLIEGVDNNANQGIKSHGRRNKNAQAISKVNAKAAVNNNNNIHGDFNNVVQVGDAKNKIDSDANAKNNKVLVEGVLNDAIQGIKSSGLTSKNVQAISKVKATAIVNNNSNIKGDFNFVLQDGIATNKIRSMANAINKKVLVEGYGREGNNVQIISSGGVGNKNAQAISDVKANAAVTNNNKIRRDYNNAAQVGKARNNIDSDAKAQN